MEEKILDILADLCEDDIVRENTDINLFESGLMDSLAYIELLVSLEEIGITIPPSEVERSDVDTPRKIVDYIMSRGNL